MRSMISMPSVSFWIRGGVLHTRWASSTICTTRCPTASRIISPPRSPTATSPCTPRSSAARASRLRCRSAPARWTEHGGVRRCRALEVQGRLGSNDKLDERLAWVASCWKASAPARPTDLLSDIKSDLLPEEVFAFTPQGRCHQPARGRDGHRLCLCDPLRVGNRMIGCKVNNRIVPIDHKVSDRRNH